MQYQEPVIKRHRLKGNFHRSLTRVQLPLICLKHLRVKNDQKWDETGRKIEPQWKDEKRQKQLDWLKAL